ncbi:MAG: winged helix-turn-helix transcriptional regulator [Candidatus Omnitrophica bacterium]|nr:winged helix-turn-helix transcriptional regulator [Candidatus Omnitrophota bacterium]
MNTDNPEIGEKEYRLINEVSRNSTITQREISQRLGFSLGMTNILLKRLIQKGYIKIGQLNRHKVQYLLTPAGIAQGMKRSYRYLFHTFHSLREIKSKIQSVLLAEYRKGQRKFIILGDGELADITEIALRDLGRKDITYSKLPQEGRIEEKNSLFLITDPKQKVKGASLDILKEIASFPKKIETE